MVTLRPPEPSDRDALIALRDEQFHRFMGEGSPDPRPTFCIVVGGDVVGWVDYDEGEREWLESGEVNMGYALHPDHRGRGYATRAIQLLIHHLAQSTDVQVATLLISPENQWSLGIAARAGFGERLELNGEAFFKRPIPPLTYTDGTVTIRPFLSTDFDRDMQAKDEEQQRWLWLPEHREHWASMTPEERVAHNRPWVEGGATDPRNGPKWTFVIDVGDQYVGYVDCDLANPNVPAGEANVSYSSHPAERGKGYVSAGVRLISQFVRDHTGAREIHIGVDEGNEASLRVARAVGAVETERYVDTVGDTMIRHVISLR